MAEITPNKEYCRYAPRWKRVRDIDDGEYQLKCNDLRFISGTLEDKNVPSRTYLRLIKPWDKSIENIEDNQSYINGAVLCNYTGKTGKMLIGMAYLSNPKHPDLPDSISYILEDANGAGVSIDQLSKATTDNVIKIGRDGLLCDMPRNEDGKQITKADVDNGFRARILRYSAESVPLWRESSINGTMMLDLVVLREITQEYANSAMLEMEDVITYKVYRLTPDGVTVEVRKEDDNGDFAMVGDAIKVTGANNTKLTKIPFTFVGSVNNQPCIDPLPLEDIANVNIGHYQESANLASSSFTVSAVTPYIADDGYLAAARNAKGKQTVELGDKSMPILGTDGVLGMAQPMANMMAQGIRKDYEEQMAALGAAIVRDSSGAETAEAARIKQGANVSTLDMVVDNVSCGYTFMLECVCIMMGVPFDKEWVYDLNRVFFDTRMTDQELTARVAAWQSGAISKAVLDENLITAKIIPVGTDLEEMNKDILDESDMVDLDEETPTVAEEE